MLFGSLGILALSFTLPATRAAVPDLGSVFVGLGRALVAAALAATLLLLTRQRRPVRKQLWRLALTGVGVVYGFPLFSALALEQLTAAHGAVIIGLLPAATALMAVARAGERPSPAFWLGSLLGLAAVLAFAGTQGAAGVSRGDLFALAAVALGAYGYAEGGALARELGGWQVICWALVLTAPPLIPLVALAAGRHGLHGDAAAWVGFAYVSVVSMFLGFFAWYRGLALGGVAKIGQLQLAQPVLTLLWAALLLGEAVNTATIVAAVAVVFSAAALQRTRVAASR